MSCKLKVFNNLFRSKALILMVLISLLSQVSIAQDNHNYNINISDGVVVRGMVIPSNGVFNYQFDLPSLVFDNLSLGDSTNIAEVMLSRDLASTTQRVYEPFLNAGVDMQFLHRYHVTPLIYAVVNEDVDAVNSIMEQEGVNLDMQDSNGLTALIWAAIVGNEGMVRSLVDAGADMQLQGEAAIQYADQKGYSHIADYLREVMENLE